MQEGYCRLRWVQARTEAAATGDKPESVLPRLRHQQLFFYGLTALWDRQPKQTVVKCGRRGRPRRPDPAPALPPSLCWLQPALVAVRRDFTRWRANTAVSCDNPWLAWGRHLAHRLGEARGWPRKTRLRRPARRRCHPAPGTRAHQWVRCRRRPPCRPADPRTCRSSHRTTWRHAPPPARRSRHRQPSPADRWPHPHAGRSHLSTCPRIAGVPSPPLARNSQPVPADQQADRPEDRPIRNSSVAGPALHSQIATLARLHMDRQLEEALLHGPDLLHLAEVFGLSEKTAIRYSNFARRLRERPRRERLWLSCHVEDGVAFTGRGNGQPKKPSPYPIEGW